MGIGSVAGAFVAGVLTVLSPCVLPILPIVLGAAASERKYGPAALGAGLAVSFVAIGLFVATIGYSVGLTADLFRQIAAALMIVLGAVLLLPNLQARLAMASGPIANWTDRRFGTYRGGGYGGQFCVGILLGAIWTPCVGPTLGAAAIVRTGPRSRGGRRQHVCVRVGRCPATTRHRTRLAHCFAKLARSHPIGRPDHESGIRHAPRCFRYAGIDRHR